MSEDDLHFPVRLLREANRQHLQDYMKSRESIFDGEIQRSTKREYTPGQRKLANKVLARLAPMPPSLCEALDEIAKKAGDKWLVDDGTRHNSGSSAPIDGDGFFRD